jgi:RNA polymerase sigma-70 factor (ECF subfamily)
VVVTELIARARAGDGDAFRELTEPHRRELQVHCYRMLGSFQDAEDALQDTLLAAWQALGGFEGRASIRTWLYRIATNRCINALRSTKRRPAKEWDVAEIEPPEPTRLGEIVWLEPYPDALLEGAIDAPFGPEARYEQTEAIALAFVTVLQVLPARQRAVLILREVLGYPASEVADMLDSTDESVNSALKRARASLHRRRPPTGQGEPPPAPDSPAEQALVAKFARAYESGDVQHLSRCSPPMSAYPCHQYRSNTKAATSWPASTPASSGAVRDITSCRRGRMVNWRSAPTCAPPPAASATAPACSSSPSPATGSAP